MTSRRIRCRCEQRAAVPGLPYVRGGMSVDRAVGGGPFSSFLGFLSFISLFYSPFSVFILIGFVLHHLALFGFIFVCLFFLISLSSPSFYSLSHPFSSPPLSPLLVLQPITSSSGKKSSSATARAERVRFPRRLMGVAALR